MQTSVLDLMIEQTNELPSVEAVKDLKTDQESEGLSEDLLMLVGGSFVNAVVEVPVA